MMPTTLYGNPTFRNPVTVIADGVASDNVLKVVGAQGVTQQLIETYDYLGNPILASGNAGGTAMLGDEFRAHYGADIFNPAFSTMVASAKNVVTNAAGIQLGHGTTQGVALFVGVGAPSSSNPVTTGIPPNGSIYFRTDGTSAGTRIYHVEAGAWVGIV